MADQVHIEDLLNSSHKQPILLFDGVCNLCNQSVQLVLKKEKSPRYQFTSLQSEVGQVILSHFDFSTTHFDTILLLEDGKIFDRSSVPIKVSGNLKGLWPMLRIFWIIPKPLRDIVYNWISRNRYKWFGKKEVCMIPSPELERRFL